MGFLRAKDTISGQEGRAYATINGRIEEMFYVKSLEAKVEKEKTELKTLGRRGTQHKATGWSGSGSMTIYYMTSMFRQMMLDYMNHGKDTYFDIQIINEDPTSSVGKQTIVLQGVNLDSMVIASLDTDAEALEEDIDFTFEGVIMQDQFKTPTLG
ncbi:phage tail tube protein [Paenibacillus alvei]|uniref:phage tail tube protein n=1 Tax=Paenibacillus alvei TaxID=44250 RepID=UPI0013DB50C8|nr:phage tail tube protein [Paenibacillus alvei]MCY9540918.1 phage tail tube protein [Paenibacillus alvei]MCY9708178.1 phage tail tube protein [Paenibacillus alvei]MEC0080189.1 phage tail tube protein [Paenibacillus alvei]NEZ43308.1 phage portal protein [Paenibacillus alvei]